MDVDLNEYKHFISLGYSCFIAEDLKRLGLREASMPFDWVFSPFDGVLTAVRTNFSDFLKYEYLYQSCRCHHAYKNIKYNINFLHDFKKEIPLIFQLRDVKKNITAESKDSIRQFASLRFSLDIYEMKMN